MTLIRGVESKDLQDIQNLLLTTFQTSAEADLVSKLRKTNFYDKELAFVAINDEQIIGYLLFTRIVIKNNKRTLPALILSTCAIEPAFQNQGIGKLLVENGLRKCKYLGYKMIFTPGNDTYFKRFGFSPIDEEQFTPLHPKHSSPLVYLLAGTSQEFKGTIHYPIEFI